MENQDYLDKVVNHLLSETDIDYDSVMVKIGNLTMSPSIMGHFINTSFAKHCEKAYGLTHDELTYVWDKYSTTIFYDMGYAWRKI